MRSPFTRVVLLGSFIALKPVIESANIVKQSSLQRSAGTPKSSGSRPSSAPSSTARFAASQPNGHPASARSQVSLLYHLVVVNFDDALILACSLFLCSTWLY
jgi:hypothetical protein